MISCKQSGTDTASADIQKDSVAINELLISGIWKTYRDAGIIYAPDHMNSADNVRRYYRPKSKIMNAGVFYTDLLFSALNKDLEKIASNTGSVSVLVGGAGFDTELKLLSEEEIIKNLIESDSLYIVIEENCSTIFSDLVEDSKIFGGLFLTGIWVEGAFLATQTWKNEDSVNNLALQNLFEDLDQLIEFLNSVPEDESVNSLLKALLSLQSLYNDQKDDLNNENLKAVYITIDTIRDSIVA